MAKMADGAGGKQGIGLFSLAVIGFAGFLVGYILSGTIAGERVANACFGDILGLSAGGGATNASCFAVLTGSFDSRPLTDGITGLVQTPLFGTQEKLELTNAVLQAHTGSPHEWQVHNVNLSLSAQ